MVLLHECDLCYRPINLRIMLCCTLMRADEHYSLIGLSAECRHCVAPLSVTYIIVYIFDDVMMTMIMMMTTTMIMMMMMYTEHIPNANMI